MEDTVLIPRRFRGPPDSGNGGYTCGVVGSLLPGTAQVTLRLPPPLERPMQVARSADGLSILDDGRVVAEARAATLELTAPPAPRFEEAEEAVARFPWRDDHPLPTCFVCGTARHRGDGMCLFPGAVTGRDIAAAPFVPDETLADADGRVRKEVVWAALDCPSWFGFQCFNDFKQLVLLGRLAARIDALPRVGDRCVVAGWALEREGRKIRCGSALYTDAGALLGIAEATWIVLK